MFIISFFLYGCFAPVNLTYESARTLNKGEIDLQGNYSSYYGSDDFEFHNYNNNYGIKIGYGIKDRYTMKVRYERLTLTKSDFEFLSIDFSDELIKAINYFEIENKLKFKNSNIALGIPMGYYSINFNDKTTDGIFAFDPRVYFTFFSKTNKIELNLIPKAHIFIGEDLGLNPGISVGLGFSNNLNKWVIRPEFGFDGYSSFGIGVNINIADLIRDK